LPERRKLLDTFFSHLSNQIASKLLRVTPPICCRRGALDKHSGEVCGPSPNPSQVPTMNKSELIDHISAEADLTKASAGRALDAMIDGVKAALKKGGTVTLVGFGTFAVGKRTARTGRNPRTGAAIKIKAAKVPKFRAGKGLKDAVN
jgi:DNA-binding protein HU-beta